MNETILAYDIGTSSLKTSIIDMKGVIVGAAVHQYNTQYLSGGIAEQDPNDWWRGVSITTHRLFEEHNDIDVVAIGVSGHMLGCLPVDSHGTPLRNSMIHSDSRSSKQFEYICRSVGEDMMYNISGNVLDARSTLSKICWIRDNEPEIYANTSKFLQSKDYVVSKLTGNINTTDYSDAAHGELMDIKKREYDKGIFAELDIDIAKLPELHKSCDIVGAVTQQSAEELGIRSGIPVIAGGGDGACANVGAGNTNVGDAYISLGSTAWIAQCIESPYFDENKRLFNIPNLDGVSQTCFGTMQSAGSSVKWGMNLLGIEDVEEFVDIAAKATEGSGGLLFLPYLDGERTPVFDSYARGIFAGVSLSQGREEFARAVLEGVSFALAEILEIFRENGDISLMRIIGGGAKSKLWKQIIADVCRCKIESLSVSASDATSLGVAAAAGTAAGVFKSINEAVSYIGIDTVSVPANEQKPSYQRNFKVYKQMYDSNKSLMHELSKQ